MIVCEHWAPSGIHVVVTALDAYESQQFWAEAEAAAAAETPEQRERRKHVEADVDAWMDSLR